MTSVSIYKYLAVAFLLLIGNACTQADDSEESEIDKETFDSRNLLLESMVNESLEVGKYMFESSEKLCQLMLVDETYEHTTSQQLESAEDVQRKCVTHVVERLDPVPRRGGLDEILLRKYGFEDIRKVVNEKYDAMFTEVVRKIDEYLKGLTGEQKNRTTARNLRMWSSKIKDAPTLALKDLTFNSCLHFYYFGRGV